MADMHLREKMKKVTEAAKQNDMVPENSKQIGLLLFLFIMIVVIIFLCALFVGFLVNNHPISAVITILIAILLAYSSFKMMKADDIR
jgi:uncharacterized membrane protein